MHVCEFKHLQCLPFIKGIKRLQVLIRIGTGVGCYATRKLINEESTFKLTVVVRVLHSPTTLWAGEW